MAKQNQCNRIEYVIYREREREREDLVLGYSGVEGVDESGIIPQVAFLPHFFVVYADALFSVPTPTKPFFPLSL